MFFRRFLKNNNLRINKWTAQFGIASIFFSFCIFAYAASSTKPMTSEQLAKELSWIPSDNPDNVCQGYYLDPFLNHQHKIIPLDQTEAETDYADLQKVGESILRGNVVIRQQNRQINADEASIFRNKEGDLEKIDLTNNVIIQESGVLLHARHGRVNADRTGTLDDVLYRIGLGELTTLKNNQNKNYQTYSINARGVAHQFQKKSADLIHVKNSTFTTCTPYDNAWQIEAKQIDLNRSTGRGTAKDVKLRIKGVPVAYMPYFNFPIDDRRQSGWLTPGYGTSSRSGIMLNAPYYFNLAPNYDDTLTPEYYSKRGFMLSNLFRYLDKLGRGEIAFSFLPDDREFKQFQKHQTNINPPGRPVNRLNDFSANRWLVNIEDKHQFSPELSTNIDFTEVSDDYYFQDFGVGVFGTSENQLPRELTVNYAKEFWNATARLQDFQTLHPINQPYIPDSYARLPQLIFNANYPGRHDLDYGLNSEAVYFNIPHNPDTDQVYTTGKRVNLNPTIQWNIERAQGYINPRLQLPTTYYDLTDQTPGFSSTIRRILPIFNIDSGLFFDRSTSWFGKAYRQTLEPRLFYLYIPYHNQREIPLFDTSLPTFSYEQLFRTNRFTGIDRIGDANQLSVALTTRFLEDETGIEKIHATIGQMIYFRNREVTLCNTPGCQDADMIGFVSQKGNVSPLTGNLVYNINPVWSVNTDAAWDPANNQMASNNFTFHYQPNSKKIVDVGYHYARNGEIVDNQVGSLKQVSLAFYWPIKAQWGTIGAWNYNIAQHHPQLYFIGLEYSSCCWATRLVAEREFVALNPQGRTTFNNVVYLQFQLKGLGKVGISNPAQLLQTQVPGYQDFMKS